jgi:cellulose synthase/poly-beta-1,6-N-acetylglucosamine synthase-like glycosyltransferase
MYNNEISLLLESVKVNDVIEVSVNSLGRVSILKSRVKRVTKTLIIFDDGSRFKKKDGEQYGVAEYDYKKIRFNSLKKQRKDCLEIQNEKDINSHN